MVEYIINNQTIDNRLGGVFMSHVQITTKTYENNSAKSFDLPTILIEYNGEVHVYKPGYVNSIKKSLEESYKIFF